VRVGPGARVALGLGLVLLGCLLVVEPAPQWHGTPEELRATLAATIGVAVLAGVAAVATAAVPVALWLCVLKLAAERRRGR
jgi:hypothetical protein